MAACAANRNHAEPKGQHLEPENQRKLSEPCALQGARTVHQGGKRREAPTYPNSQETRKNSWSRKSNLSWSNSCENEDWSFQRRKPSSLTSNRVSIFLDKRSANIGE